MENQENLQIKPQKTGKGFFIAGSILLALSAVFFAIALYAVLDYTPPENTGYGLLFLLMIIAVGWISVYPGFICGTLGAVFLGISFQRSNKKLSLIFAVLSGLIALACVAILVVLGILA